MKGEIITDPVQMLAADYAKDLEKLRSIDIVIVTPIDIKRVKSIAEKYGKNYKISEDNFESKVGELSQEILKRLESLAIEHVLERVREVSPSRKPRKPKIDKGPEPEELWKG